jgi:hypothetical protein
MAITKISNSGVNGSKYDIVSADNYYMEPIATTLVTASSAANITFSNIPSGYKHLQLRGIYRSTFLNPGAEELKVEFNSDTGSNYAYHSVAGQGSSAFASSGANQTGIRTVSSFPSDQTTASCYGAAVIDILDYANTSKYKTLRALNGFDSNGTGYLGLTSGLWMNTGVITSIKLSNWASSEVFKQYSRFSLYGIRG